MFGCCWLLLIDFIVCAVVIAAIFNGINVLVDDGIFRIVAADVNVENGFVDGDNKSDNQSQERFIEFMFPLKYKWTQ